MRQTAPLIDLTTTTQGFLPNAQTRMTRGVWRQVAGDDIFDPEDPRSRDLGVYLAFAVIGVIGCDRLRTNGCETTVMPVAFETGHFEVMVTIKHGPTSAPRITLSLPGESLNPGSE
jgi:hypothetical protein